MEKMQQQLIELAISSETPENRIAEALNVLRGGTAREASPDKYLDVGEAQKYLGGISRAYLWKLRRENQLPSYQVGKRILFKAEEIEKWMSKNFRQKK